MSTRRYPGPFACHDRAGEDEPIFTLLGRDPHAPTLLRQWAQLRDSAPDRADNDAAKAAEARAIADQMEAFRARRDGRGSN